MAGPAPTWADLAATWRVGYRRQGQRQADKSPCRAQERKQRERGGAGGEEVVGQVRSERKVLRTWCWGTMGGLAGTLRCQGRLREHVGGEGGQGAAGDMEGPFETCLQQLGATRGDARQARGCLRVWGSGQGDHPGG